MTVLSSNTPAPTTPFDRPYFNLILIGAEGSRLLPTGRAIAERSGAQFTAIELELRTREGYSSEDLRALYGIARLRRAESEICRELILMRGAVIGISTLTLLDEETRDKLAGAGTLLALTCDLDETLRRAYIAQGAQFHDPASHAVVLERIVRDRQAFRAVQVPMIDTTRLSIEAVAEQALTYWRTHDQELITPHAPSLTRPNS
jgi:shikimate kinase